MQSELRNCALQSSFILSLMIFIFLIIQTFDYPENSAQSFDCIKLQNLFVGHCYRICVGSKGAV